MYEIRRARELGGIPGSETGRAGKFDPLKSNRTNPRPQYKNIDYRETARAALAEMPSLIYRLIPGGKLCGNEYTVRNPTRADRSAGSFKINIVTGRWADFARFNARGGDIVSLVAYLNHTNQREAALLLLGLLDMRP